MCFYLTPRSIWTNECVDLQFCETSWFLVLEDDSASDSVDVVPDIGPTVKETAVSQMDAAIVALSRELAKLRTGRASAGMWSVIP